LIPERENLLISSAEDGVICLWNLQELDPKQQLIKTLETPAQKLKRDLLLNNFQVNPFNEKEVLICHRYRSAYLVNLETAQVIQEYQTNQSKDEELLYSQFSGDANHVYAFSSTKNLYIFDKKNGKLVSLLLIPTDKTEINGFLVALET
jgi:WD40 repeat protein